MSATTEFSIKHSIPGRLRVTFPALVSQKKLTRHLKTHLSTKPGIDHVQSNHFCGSVTIEYNPEISDKQHILHMIKGVRFGDPNPAEIPSISSVKEPEVDLRHPFPKNRKKDLVRKFWKVSGSICMGVGIVGIFVPLLPTLPLFLAAGFCYWRGSPKFYNRLIHFGPVGPLIDNFRKGKGLPAKLKSRAILFMWISMATTMVFFVNSNTLRAIILAVGIGVTLYILRIKTAEPIIDSPDHQKIPFEIEQGKSE